MVKLHHIQCCYLLASKLALQRVCCNDVTQNQHISNLPSSSTMLVDHEPSVGMPKLSMLLQHQMAIRKPPCAQGKLQGGSANPEPHFQHSPRDPACLAQRLQVRNVDQLTHGSWRRWACRRSSTWFRSRGGPQT